MENARSYRNERYENERGNLQRSKPAPVTTRRHEAMLRDQPDGDRESRKEPHSSSA